MGRNLRKRNECRGCGYRYRAQNHRLVISTFKDNDEDGGELTAQQKALIENFEAQQELSKSATQSDTEQLSNEQFDGDDHDQI